jgi:hypothetical protein
VEDDGTVSKVEGIWPVDLLPVREPDNPFNNQDYAEGWENGLASIESGLLESLRLNLVPVGMFLSDDGTAVTLKEASRRVTNGVTADGNTSRSSPHITGEDLYDFLETAQLPVQAPAATRSDGLSPGASNPSIPASPEPTIPIPNPNRRAAVVEIVSALVSGSVSWVAAPKVRSRATGTDPERAQLPSYVPPTVWDALPKGLRQRYLLLDHMVTIAEQDGLTSLVAGALDWLMRQNDSYDGMKMFAADYIRDAFKSALLFALVDQGVVVSNSNANTRRIVVTTAEYILDTQGRCAVGPGVANRLRQAQREETDSAAKRILDRVIPKLDAAGL